VASSGRPDLDLFPSIREPDRKAFSVYNFRPVIPDYTILA